MNKVLFGARIEKVETRADRTIKLVVGTSREMSAEDKTALFSLADQEGWCVFSANDDITTQDIPEVKADTMTGGKTPSQRLRATLFVLWTQRGKQGDFESYYRTYMERIIETIKDKLE